jgi:sugar phosphate isomerase/epimerase
MRTHVGRRSFLKTLGAAGLAFAVPHASRCAPAGPPRKFTRDLVCGNLGVKATLSESIEFAHAYGFESVGPDPGYLARLSDDELREMLENMKAKGVAWGAAGLSVDFRGDASTFESGMKTLPDAAKSLLRAGATRVGTWLNPAHRSLTYLANFKQHAHRLRGVASVLADHNVRLGLEYVGPKTSWTAAKYPFVHTMAEMRELIAEIDRPNVGLVLDSWHWYTAGESEADILALTNHDVVACDLNDAPAGVPVDQQKDSVRKLPCATGVIPLKAFLEALVQIGYDGPVRAEPFDADLRKRPPEEALAATAESLERAFALVE